MLRKLNIVCALTCDFTLLTFTVEIVKDADIKRSRDNRYAILKGEYKANLKRYLKHLEQVLPVFLMERNQEFGPVQSQSSLVVLWE